MCHDAKVARVLTCNWKARTCGERTCERRRSENFELTGVVVVPGRHP